MSATACSLALLGGGVLASLRSAKLLRRRDALARLELEETSEGESGWEERVLELRVSQTLAKHEAAVALKFWAVFATLVLVEVYADPLLGLLPFYFSLKFLLVLWVVASDGAVVLFDNLLAPRFVRLGLFWERHVVPWVLGVLLALQEFVAEYVLSAAAAAMATPEQVYEVEESLATLQARLRKVRLELDHAALDARVVSLPDGDEEGSDVGEPVARRTRRRARSSEEDEKNLAEPKSGTYFLHWWTSDSEVVQEEERGRRGSWMKDAFEGVIGLTTGTRDVILGGREGVESHEVEELKEDSSFSTSSFYQRGFDALSDCEDSSDGGSLSFKSAIKGEDVIVDELERKKRNLRAKSKELRKRPVTRASSKMYS